MLNCILSCGVVKMIQLQFKASGWRSQTSEETLNMGEVVVGLSVSNTDGIFNTFYSSTGFNVQHFSAFYLSYTMFLLCCKGL